MASKKRCHSGGCDHSCCDHHNENEELDPIESTDKDLAVPDTRERIVIPKFSVDSAIFMVYTSHDGDKGMTITRAVSYPKFENLLTDLGLFNQWLLDYYDDCKLSISSIPKDVKQDPADVAMVTIRDEAKGEETRMVISICVIPNSQNLEEIRQTTNGKPRVLDLYTFSPQAFYKAFHFILSDFENRLVEEAKKYPKEDDANRSSEEDDPKPPLNPAAIPRATVGKEEDDLDLLLGTLMDILGRMRRR